MLPVAVSILAPIITAIELVPQLYKTLKHKRVRDLSFPTMVLMLLSGIIWMTHGYFIEDLTLIVSSFVVTIMNSVMICIYLLFSL